MRGRNCNNLPSLTSRKERKSEIKGKQKGKGRKKEKEGEKLRNQKHTILSVKRRGKKVKTKPNEQKTLTAKRTRASWCRLKDTFFTELNHATVLAKPNTIAADFDNNESSEEKHVIKPQFLKYEQQ